MGGKGDSGGSAAELAAPYEAPSPSWGGACSPEHQAEQRSPPSQEDVPKPLRTLHCGEGSQARLIEGLLARRKIRVVCLRCPYITPGSAAPRYGVSGTARGRGRGQQCPGGGSRDPAAAGPHRQRTRAGRGPACCGLGPWGARAVGGAGGSRRGGSPSHPAPQCHIWHDRASAGTSRECSPRRLLCSCPQVPAGVELSRGSCRGPGQSGHRGVPYRSAMAPRGRVTLHTAAITSTRIC